MTTRQAEKAARRRAREEREREIERAEQRARRLRRFGLLGVAVAAVAVVAVVALSGQSNPGADAGAGEDPFGPHPDGLAERVEQAGLPANGMEAPGAPHIHSRLKVYVDGREVPIPVNIGIAGQQMAPLHTHETDGTIHQEGVAKATLGQFMTVWGVPFSATRLGPHRAGGANRVRMWVKQPGKDRFTESKSFGSLELRDRQEIYLAYGPDEKAPIAD